jgi:SAM-dependent methyltransferase
MTYQVQPQTNIHISYAPSAETVDYHQMLVKNIVALVQYAQEQAGRPLTVLDVGAGRGELLSELKQAGISAVGLDFDYNCALQCSTVAPAIQGDVNNVAKIFKEKSFDLVIASHVLEHMDSPSHLLRSIAQITCQFLIIAVPNLAEFVNVQWRRNEPRLVNLGHTCGWDASHLKTLLASCHFNAVRWQADRVYLHGRIRPAFTRLGLRKVIEDSFLPALFPFQSHSLIVLAELADPTE